jgi:CDP-diacylglycerol--glycerol-3-phosphate 3-phosphatidyltransferase
MSTFTGAIGSGAKWAIDRIVIALAATGINPNVLTFLGLLVNFGAAANFAVGNFRTGAIVVFIAGFLDMLDGQVARRQDRVTAFGAFYDSTLDRYADMALYMGSLIPLCKVGFMERPERMVLLIIGGLFNRMAQVLWVIAIVSTITVVHRIFFTWQETRAGRILPALKPNS